MRARFFSFLAGMVIGFSAGAEAGAETPEAARQAGVLLGRMFHGEDVANELRPHAVEACDILALPSLKRMTRIRLAELAWGDAEQQTRAVRSLGVLGDQAASEVRAFRDAHAGDPALVARCEEVLTKQGAVTEPESVPEFPPTPVVRFLLTVPDLPLEKVTPLEPFYQKALVSGREEMLTLDELTPETLEALLHQTAALENAGKRAQRWLAREPSETFETLAMAMLTERFETAFPLLLACQRKLDVLLRIMVSPDLAEKAGEAEWETLVGAIAESTLGSDAFLEVLDQLEEIPEEFTINAHRLMEDKHRRHVALGGLFQTRYPVPGDVSREPLRELIGEKVSFHQWDKFLTQRELDPLDALYLLSVYSWRVGDFANPAVIHLLDLTDSVSDADLLGFLEGRKPNYFLLTLFAIRRSALEERIVGMIFQGVKEAFTQYRYHLAGNCMQRLTSSTAPPGMFDEEWLDLYEQHDENPKYRDSSLFILFVHAPRYRITPEVLWEKYRLHEEELMEHRASFMRKLPDYILEHGGPELRKEMLSRVVAPSGEGTEADKAMRPDFNATLQLDPAENEGLLALQAQMFYQKCLEGKVSNFPGLLFRTSFAGSRYKDTADFYRRNREGIQAVLADEDLRPALLPLLAVCGMDDDLRREDRDFLREAIRTCVNAYPEPDGILLGGGFIAALLGLEDESIIRAFAESLALPVPGYNSHWKILVSLNEDHRFLLPGLIRAADREESSMYPLLAMIRIAPGHPEVVKRVEHALYEAEDHPLACHVMMHLSWIGAAPGLDSFSDDRIDWMLQLDSKDSLYSSRRFVDALSADDQDRIVERLVPRLKEVALGYDSFFTFYRLFSKEERQLQAVDALFGLLASDEPNEYGYAVRELSNFSTFSPRQLRLLAMNINRFEGHQNAINIRPRLMAALCNAGADAAFLEREIRHHADQGDEYLRPVALRALAGITDDPAEWQSCFDQLVWTFRNENSWKSKQVRQISRMQGGAETVIPFLQEIILAYGSEGGSDDRFVQEAVWGLPFQTSSPEVVIPLFRHIWEVGSQKPGHDDVLESMLYTVAHDYPELIPMFRKQMEDTPLRHRVYLGYRKMELALKEGQP